MDIENLRIRELRDLRAQIDALINPQPTQPTVTTAMPEHAYPVGKNVFIRTVTMHYTGKLQRVTAGELVLIDAAWIAESGRFATALKTGSLSEVEPFPDGEVVILRDGVIEVSAWRHALPREQK